MPVRQRGKDSYQVDVTHDGKRFRESFNGTKSNADIISAVVLDCMKHNKDIKSEVNKKWGEYMSDILKADIDPKTNFPYLLPIQMHLD